MYIFVNMLMKYIVAHIVYQVVEVIMLCCSLEYKLLLPYSKCDACNMHVPGLYMHV